MIGQIKSKLSSSLGPGTFIDSLGIQKKPVHVEDERLYVFHFVERTFSLLSISLSQIDGQTRGLIGIDGLENINRGISEEIIVGFVAPGAYLADQAIVSCGRKFMPDSRS